MFMYLKMFYQVDSMRSLQVSRNYSLHAPFTPCPLVFKLSKAVWDEVIRCTWRAPEAQTFLFFPAGVEEVCACLPSVRVPALPLGILWLFFFFFLSKAGIAARFAGFVVSYRNEFSCCSEWWQQNRIYWLLFSVRDVIIYRRSQKTRPQSWIWRENDVNIWIRVWPAASPQTAGTEAASFTLHRCVLHL